jgi:hypothetical protein
VTDEPTERPWSAVGEAIKHVRKRLAAEPLGPIRRLIVLVSAAGVVAVGVA